VRAPVPGRVLPLAQVPDPVFAQAMVGPGAAVDPVRGPVDAVAPIDGTLVKVLPHAFVVAPDAGPAVLVHLGIDTVQLAGEHFEVRVAQGDRVRAGDVVTSWDTAAVEAGGRSPIVPVIALDTDADRVRLADAVHAGVTVAAGDALLVAVP
jgi:sugar PTS system EIIA component